MKQDISVEEAQNLQVTILAVGSRGDVEPYCALAVGLKHAGHTVKIATHENFKEFVRKQDLEFACIAGNFRELLSSSSGHKLLENKSSKLVSDEMFQKQLADSWQACQGSDVVIFGPLATWGYHIAEKLAIPCFMAACMPLSPTREFPFLKSQKASIHPFNGLFNYASYLLIEFLSWQKNRLCLNRFRKETLDLIPLPFFGARFTRKRPKNVSPLPVLYGFSQSVVPRPADWPDWLHVTGYWFLEQKQNYQPPKELVDFINDGLPPVCIGFGSMTPKNPDLLTEMVLEALESTKQRGILLSGWAGIGFVKNPNNIFVIDWVPHDWLFPQMAAVVHHGGSGTTAAACRAGVPSIIVPFLGDQFFWGERITDLGVGPSPIRYKELSASRLADAIQVAVNDEAMRSRAIALGNKIKQEDGVANAVSAFQCHLKHMSSAPPLA